MSLELSAAEKRALLARLLWEKAVRGREVSALSHGQRSLWFLYRLAPESTAYNLVDAVRIRGPLDVPAMRRAFQKLVDRHPSLRTTFHEAEGQPFQKVHADWPVPFQVVDATGWNDVTLGERLSAEAHTPFDLEKGPAARSLLFRLAASDHVLVFLLHHIVADSWSLVLCIHEFSILYEAERAGTKTALPPPPSSYAAFVRWQANMLASTEGQQHLTYWKEQLAGELPVLILPTDNPRPRVQTYRGAWLSRQLSPALLQGIKALSAAHGTTPFLTLLAAYHLLLHHYSGQQDILVGCPTAGRPRAEFAAVVGYFVNPIVVRGDLTGNPTFVEFLARERRTILEAFDHQDYPFALLVEQLQPKRDPGRSPIFQTMFVMQKAQLLHSKGLTDFMMEESEARITLSGFQAEAIPFVQRDAQFDLSLQLAEAGHGLATSFQYNTDLFESLTITRLLEHWQRLLEGIVEAPERRLSDFPLLSAAERQTVLVEWNATRADYPRERCIHQLFEEQVERTPEAVALVWEGRSWSYAELNRRANQLAHHLRALGVGPEVLVGIGLERSLDMVLGLLGILKAGGAYVPLDPTYPPDRLTFMLEDSRAPILVTRQALRQKFPEHQAVVCLDTDALAIAAQNAANPVSETCPDNLAYVIYTSGSTRQPRGVLIPHRGVVNHNVDFVTRYGLHPGDRVLQFASINFDTAAEEMFPAWLAGATVVLKSERATTSLQAFLEFVAEEKITVLDLPTSFWHLWVAELSRAELPWTATLRWVIVGGEKVLPERLARWREFTGNRVNWSNTYGPTEATIQSTTYELMIGQQPPERGVVPIGRPIANTEVYILNGSMQSVPIGVPGELHIGGSGVARGYLNQAELTSARFVPDPFRAESEGRLYKTGDRARWLPDGNLEFLGRLDQQVKIRGYRIEPEEIETVLAKEPRVREAVVLAREDMPGDRRLVAYVVPDPARPLTVPELRGFLRKQLPEYMIPTVFVMLETLPRTPSGKLDRRSLPSPDRARPELDETFVVPRTEEEKLLADIWSELLGVQGLGIHDNFFELGGDSILGLQMLSRAGHAGLRFTPRQLYEQQTIAALAADAGHFVAVEAEQGPVVGTVPLTPIQHWFFEQGLAELNRWNQAIWMNVPDYLDPSRVEQVLQQFLVHHDALRLRFHQGQFGWQQVIAEPGGPLPFARKDLSTLTEGEQERAIEAATVELQASLNISEGPLVRLVLLELGPEKPSRLLLVIHHLAIDSVSWRILLDDFSTAAQQLLAGQHLRLPPKTTSFRQWAQWLTERARSVEVKEETAFWLAQGSRTRPTSLPVDFPDGINTRESAEGVWLSLTAAETRTLLQQVLPVLEARINEVLLAGLVSAFARWTGQATLLVDVEGHGREGDLEGVDLTRTVGWFACIYPILLEIHHGERAEDAVREVQAQLHQIPNRGLGYGLLRYLGNDPEVAHRLQACPQAWVSFNYVGQFGPNGLAASVVNPAQQAVDHIRSLVGLRRYLLDFDGFISDDCLHLGFTYSKNLHHRSTIARLGEDFREALRALIATSTSTITTANGKQQGRLLDIVETE